MEKIKVTVKVIYRYDYETSFGYQSQDKRKYKMKDDSGRTYWWDTTSWLCRNEGEWDWYYVKQGDVVQIEGFVKKYYEYKGEPQADLQRVKLLDIIEKALTKEERDAKKKADQLASLKEGDFVWEMPYRQYKAHYSDCETLAGSYHEYPTQDIYTPATIGVIIRNGRLKPSGTRGGHYRGYVMENEEGKKLTFRAISEETATKAANREAPGHTWVCVKIYDYANSSWS